MNEWDEIGYLYDKVLYWLYQRNRTSKAAPFVKRLTKLLSKADRDQESIFGQECRSLVCESNGDLEGAIKHRLDEIRKIRRLHTISIGKPNEEYVLSRYGFDALADRLDLLATLYYDNNQTEKAIKALRESKELCDAHGIKFDGAKMLRDFQSELVTS
jgi:tetratricopeptide (TPR) repeat protein